MTTHFQSVIYEGANLAVECAEKAVRRLSVRLLTSRKPSPDPQWIQRQLSNMGLCGSWTLISCEWDLEFALFDDEEGGPLPCPSNSADWTALAALPSQTGETELLVQLHRKGYLSNTVICGTASDPEQDVLRVRLRCTQPLWTALFLLDASLVEPDQFPQLSCLQARGGNLMWNPFPGIRPSKDLSSDEDASRFVWDQLLRCTSTPFWTHQRKQKLHSLLCEIFDIVPDQLLVLDQSSKRKLSPSSLSSTDQKKRRLLSTS